MIAARDVEWNVDVWTSKKPQTMRQYRGVRELQMNQRDLYRKQGFFGDGFMNMTERSASGEINKTLQSFVYYMPKIA